MINVQWENDAICDNCNREHVPHCALISFAFGTDGEAPPFEVQLCSDCIEDLKRRLS